ncbi:YggT family protein [Breznakiella homolactica]|uniref:YggT family protein n=1 Tax=Breznakiella homolactica TaxID=2798577 RepID=A0A7T7XRC4_9SPIR|nr:YggT family protein [Breznakiella homolactica]QQO11081.1 YggT family protein [Breznakiella homolactica]
MRFIMNLLGSLTSIYMILIFIRVLLSWFSGASYGRVYEILARITDPYLNWFRRFPALRTGTFDFSPIVALAVLSLLNNIFLTAAVYGRISLGIILALVLSALWSAVSFILSFCIIILVIRLIAYLTNRNIYSTFWRIIDSLSQPILYRINRLIFRDRITNYKTGIITAVVVLLVVRIGLEFVIRLAAGLLVRLPI